MAIAILLAAISIFQLKDVIFEALGESSPSPPAGASWAVSSSSRPVSSTGCGRWGRGGYEARALGCRPWGVELPPAQLWQVSGGTEAGAAPLRCRLRGPARLEPLRGRLKSRRTRRIHLRRLPRVFRRSRPPVPGHADQEFRSRRPPRRGAGLSVTVSLFV